jgi:hypothetical protein
MSCQEVIQANRRLDGAYAGPEQDVVKRFHKTEAISKIIRSYGARFLLHSIVLR